MSAIRGKCPVCHDDVNDGSWFTRCHDPFNEPSAGKAKTIFGSVFDWLGAVVGGKKRPNYVADFETTTDPLDCRVWAYGLANIDTAESLWDVEIGTSIERFCNR